VAAIGARQGLQPYESFDAARPAVRCQSEAISPAMGSAQWAGTAMNEFQPGRRQVHPPPMPPDRGRH